MSLYNSDYDEDIYNMCEKIEQKQRLEGSVEIASLSKSLIVTKLHRYVRIWYISGKLPESLKIDPCIVPYFTPCPGHGNINSSGDTIDGPFTMQAYCAMCREINRMSYSVSETWTGERTQKFTNPLSINWGDVDAAEWDEIHAEERIADRELHPSCYEPSL